MASIGWVGDMVGLDKILDIFGGCWMDCGVCEKRKSRLGRKYKVS